MAKKQSSSKRRSQGGGRTANSEPRLQVFRDFAGCNFELSPREFTLGVEQDADEQSDLQMNYVVVQNNARITSNKTIETRPNLVKVFSRPDDAGLTGTCMLVGEELFAATTNHDIAYGYMFREGTPGKLDKKVRLDDVAGTGRHWWFSFAYADGKLVATTLENELWTGDIEDHEVANARRIPDPDPVYFSSLEPQGTLKLSREFTEECCFRTAVAYSLVSKFGPTKVSEPTVFYSSVPVSEWHSGCWLKVSGEAPYGYDVEAVEVYYNVDNASSLVFAGRVDEGEFRNPGGTRWSFSWFGYLDVTSMWPMANLAAPTENYTKGVPASYAKCIDGRMYFWGSAFDPYRLYIGGNPGNMFSVSPGTGGGFVDVEPDTGQEIQFVEKYKTQSGNSIVTMLCSSANTTRDQRYNLVENTVTISNEQSMKSWQAEQVAGAVGCRSPHAAIVCEDGLYTVTSYGVALTTMTMEYNSQIRANYISGPVKPVFTNMSGFKLRDAILLEVDGVLYVALSSYDDAGYDNVILCYDIDAKAWWTYTVDLEGEILNLIHIDWANRQEGIGIVTAEGVWMIPTTMEPGSDDPARFDVLIETGELAAQMPQQGWIHLSQLEFDFDRFLGDLEIELVGIDQFGRKVTVSKRLHQPETVYGHAEFMRVDLKLRSYKLVLRGRANFRLTHFIAKVYTLSNKVGLVWGFDDRMSFRSEGDIHPTFRSYNDVRDAIIP